MINNVVTLMVFRNKAKEALKEAEGFIALADMYRSKGDFEKAEDSLILSRVATVKARAFTGEALRLAKELKGDIDVEE